MARASLWGRTSGSRFNVTVTCPTRSSRTFPTRPFFTPDTRTGSPSFRPLTFLNTTSTGIALETIERPVSQNIKPVNTTKPTSTRAPTVTSRLYVTSTRHSLGLDQRHLEIALQELQHRWILGREDLVRRADGADLRLPQQRHPVRHAERAPHVGRGSFRVADRVALLWQAKIRTVGPPDQILASKDPAVLQFLERDLAMSMIQAEGVARGRNV